MTKNIFFIAMSFTITLSSCSWFDNKKENKVSLVLDWIPTMSFAGDYVVKDSTAKLENLLLEIVPASEGVDPLKMVIAGQNDVGIVSAEKFYNAVNKGADLVAFAVADYITPAVFISKKEKNILAPTDFYGKKIGVQSGGSTEIVYKALVKKMNLDVSKYQETPISFDIKPFIGNAYDVRPGFIFDEAVALDMQKIAYNLIEPKNLGLLLPGRVYFCKRSFFNEKKELLSKYVKTTKAGWAIALANNEYAIKNLQKNEPKIDYLKELAGLQKGIPYLSGENGKVLNVSKATWESMLNELITLEILPKSDYTKATDFTLTE